ncbi:MAG TPA: hypothetical protein PKA95_12775 [Thermomicrobiales bacterium]|nr:hypothetical protein [Thermomicrobiales bacterium]
MPDKKYTKVEEEIIQILDRMENEPPKTRQPHLRLVHSSRSAPRRRRFSMPSLPALSPGITLALVFGFAFVALMTSGLIQIVATILSLGCFVLLLARRGRTGGGGSSIQGSKTWRGRDISLSPDDGEPIGDRIRDWIRRVRR